MFQLLELPPEIVQVICRAAGLVELARLSQTCSALRAYAQPILFRFPWFRRRGLVSLVRAVAARPDLARKVQKLYLDYEWQVCQLEPEDVKQFNVLMSKFLGEDGKPVHVSPHWFLESRVPRGDGRFTNDALAALCALLVAHTPNVESLKIMSYYGWEFPFCQPNSLLKLTELRLEHGDTELGTDIDSVRGIILAAPNLETFHGHMIRGLSASISHENLVEVNLKVSSLEAKSFREIMTGFTRLKTFSYESGGAIISDANEATPREVSEALRIRADTLEYVDLDFEEAFYIDSIGPGDVITDLKEMKRLKTLIFQGSAILPATDGFITDGNLLLNMLPPSIQSLTIDNPYKEILGDILKLADGTYMEFPDLKELLLFGMDDDDYWAVEVGFRGTKVRVSY